MSTTNATNFRKNVFEYLRQAVNFNDVVSISTKDGNAVLMSEEDYRALMETVYLMSVPGMAQRLKAAAAEPVEEGVDAEEVDW